MSHGDCVYRERYSFPQGQQIVEIWAYYSSARSLARVTNNVVTPDNNRRIKIVINEGGLVVTVIIKNI